MSSDFYLGLWVVPIAIWAVGITLGAGCIIYSVLKRKEKKIMDCSKTEVFLKELVRMCKGRDYCSNCPLGGKQVCGISFCSVKPDNLFKLRQIVQKWSDEYPQETVLEHFKKVLPNMTVEVENDRQEAGSVCPHMLDERIPHGRCMDYLIEKYPCGECWNRPYDEAIRGSKE